MSTPLNTRKPDLQPRDSSSPSAKFTDKFSTYLKSAHDEARRQSMALDESILLILGFISAGILAGSIIAYLLYTLELRLNAIEAMAASTPAIFLVGVIASKLLAGRTSRILPSREALDLELAETVYNKTYNAINRENRRRLETGEDESTVAAWAEYEFKLAITSYLRRADQLYRGHLPPLGEAAHLHAGSATTAAQESTSENDRSSLPMTSPINLPHLLITAKHEGKLVPFIGAGLSQSTGVQGGFPGWPDLPKRLLEECDRHLVWQDDHDKATSWARFRIADAADPSRDAPRPMPLREMLRQLDQLKDKLDADYGKALDAIFRPANAAPGAGHQAIIDLRARTILTTNYDRLLETVAGQPDRTIHVWRSAANAMRDVHAGRDVLLKVHGTVEDPDSVVLTLDEYRVAHQHAAYTKALDLLLGTHSFLFVGYGMEDPDDLDIILEDNAEQLASANPLHFALLQRLPDRQAEAKRADHLRRTYHVKVIPYRDHAEVVPFLEALARA
ncbi:SIR2 family protein [Nannocystis sp.]|uniref:SIR2 family protein n=1 Tax=Nannocystis sp. TaxID=1962667 RepID=UPI0025CBD2C1|nr:SIR2 family protein [Nannocystis sp.]MBK7825473.1 SIR2 family protein [Nannocystis sp.]